MLALSSLEYYVPVRVTDEAGIRWICNRKDNPTEELRVQTFNYTIEPSSDSLYSSRDRITFIYDGPSVKPTPRTLRKRGQEATSKLVSVLSSNKMFQYDLGFND